jgi:hypothetical protein
MTHHFTTAKPPPPRGISLARLCVTSMLVSIPFVGLAIRRVINIQDAHSDWYNPASRHVWLRIGLEVLGLNLVSLLAVWAVATRRCGRMSGMVIALISRRQAPAAVKRLGAKPSNRLRRVTLLMLSGILANSLVCWVVIPRLWPLLDRDPRGSGIALFPGDDREFVIERYVGFTGIMCIGLPGVPPQQMPWIMRDAPPAWAQIASPKHPRIIVEQSCGWPARSFRCYVEGTDADLASGADLAPIGSFGGKVNLGRTAPSDWGLIPRLPIWRGVLINSLALGAAMAALWELCRAVVVSVPRLRRQYNWFYGYCPQCQYDRGGQYDTRCPECGMKVVDVPSRQTDGSIGAGGA